jgi:PAS domain S-box-containing protein
MQLFLLAFIMALPAAGIIVYSGIQTREHAIADAKSETQKLADSIAAENQNLIAAAQQLIIALTQLPDVKRQNAAKVQPVLRDILKLNSQFSNIFIADRNGLVWATAVPVKPPFIVSDRRYFRNALASGQLSSGEYVISRATTKPAFNVAYPLKDDRDTIIGVISVGFILDAYKQALDRAKLPAGSSFILLDHKGVVLYRAISPLEYIGKQYDSELFKHMQEGPEVHTYVGLTSIGGDKRIVSYRKLHLPGEQSPYMYIRTGIPVDIVLSKSNRELVSNLVLFSSLLALVLFFAWLIGKRSIADRVTLLENASRDLARGDLQVRISDLVVGGELGGLGQTFDTMACQLAAREKALIDSEKNYRTIFNATKDAIFVHDAASGTIIETNKTAEELYGYSQEELMQLATHDISQGEPPYSSIEATRWIQKTIREGSQQFEWLAKRKNGECFWVEVVLSVADVGREGRVLAVVRDITERKNAEEEKQKLQIQLVQVQKMESIGQLAGGIAHDFNNILAAIVGYGSVLQMKLKADDPSRLYLDQILDAAERAANLTQSLLAFSRKQVINPKDLDLNDLIRKVEKFLSRIIGEDIEMRLTLSPERLTVFADRSQIEQVLMNLATNARDAMPNGGQLILETMRVEINDDYIRRHGYGSPGPYALLSISDTGSGIDARTREKIFEPFFTTKELGRGTGLGLSIVYGIVKQNKGYINVYSETGRGTTFRIYLPLITIGSFETQPADVSPEPPRGGTETILLTEDDEQVRRLTKSVLEEYGYTVIETADGAQALEQFRANKDRIHLILVDVIMPRKNGREVYNEAKQLKPDLKALFTSGYPADFIQKEGVLEEELNFISKPTSVQDLLKKVREVLDR